MLDCFLQVKTDDTCTSNHDEGETNEPGDYIVALFGCLAGLEMVMQQSPHLMQMRLLNTHELPSVCGTTFLAAIIMIPAPINMK